MAEKITYILGAGASIGAFPIVKGTKQWNDQGLAEWLVNTGHGLTQSVPVVGDHRQTVLEISAALIETGNKAKKFGNVDTYAKYLYHTRQEDKLSRVKIALTYFFVSRQVCLQSKIQENRYLNFITSIIDDRHLFPSHVKILNWNYDFLLEQVGSLYRKELFSVGEKSSVRSPAFVEYFPQCGYEFNLTHPDYVDKHFSLVHLNGIAGFYLQKHSAVSGIFQSIFNDLGVDPDRDISEADLLKAFHNKYVKNPHLITFAWEKQSQSQDSLVNSNKIAQEIIKDTTMLVVIGYSFPFYNREVDNMIFETVKPTLKKIYFQDPKINGQFLKNRYELGSFESMGYPELSVDEIDVEIEHITDTDQFYIPVEV